MNLCIFIDLDETLIHSNDEILTGHCPVSVGVDTFYSQLRPHAHTMLKDLRMHAPVKLITASTRAYALAQIEAHKLGFEASDVVARENFMHKSYKIPSPTHPLSILIDDLPSVDPLTRKKVDYLRIPEENCILISEYLGGEDSLRPGEWRKIIKQVTRLLRAGT